MRQPSQMKKIEESRAQRTPEAATRQPQKKSGVDPGDRGSPSFTLFSLIWKTMKRPIEAPTSTANNKPGTQRVQALADISRSALCCHSNETRAPIANPPNSAQLEGIPYHPASYIRVRAVVWECSEGQTDTQTRVHRRA